MGFFSGALTGLTRGVGTELDRQRVEAEQSQNVIRQIALRGVLDPNTPPELRSQYQALLRGTPYEEFASFEIPTTPEQQLQRQFGPLLSALQLLGGLGQAGGLTPELAGQIEAISGQQFLPRREVPGGPAPAPGQDVAGTALREEIDISRFRPAGAVSITLANGQTVPLEALRGLPAELVMHLVKGPGGVSVRTYGDLFGDLIKPGLRNRPIVTDENGRIVLRDDFFVREPTPTDVQATARGQRQQEAIRVWQTTGDWAAASRIDPTTFPPQTAITLANQQRRVRGIQAYTDWLATHPDDLAGAAKKAAGVDPTWAAPGLPSALTPQNEVLRKYFAGQPLNDNERTWVQRQLQTQAQQDPHFAELMRIVAAYGSRAGSTTNPLDAQEGKLYDNAVDELRGYFGIPSEAEGGPKPGIVEFLIKKLSGWYRGVPAPKKGTAPTQRAQQVYDTWTSTKKRIPSKYWRQLTADEKRWLLALGVSWGD